MADLASGWGVTPNTVSRRLAFLGIKPIRQGNFRFLTAEQLELAEALQQHVLAGRPMEAFEVPGREGQGLVARRVQNPQPAHGTGLVVRDLEELLKVMEPFVERTAVKLTAMNAGPQRQRATPDPLRKAKLLAEAAELDWLSPAEVAKVLGRSQGELKELQWPHTPRPGYRVEREQFDGQDWFRVIRASQRPAALPPAETSHATSQPVGMGFHRELVACGAITVQAVSLPRF